MMHWFELQTPVDPFLVEEQGFTYLMLACANEDYPAVVRLIQEGAPVNAANKFGVTALQEAVRYAYRDEAAALSIVQLLLDSGADIDAQTTRQGETALMQAAYYGYNALLRILLDRGATVNLRRTDGDTVLSSLEAAPSVVRKRKRILAALEKAGGIR